MKAEKKKKKTSPTNNEQTIVKTDIGAKDGQNKCPKCGCENDLKAKFCNNCGAPFKEE